MVNAELNFVQFSASILHYWSRRRDIHGDFFFFFFTINIESPCLSNFARD